MRSTPWPKLILRTVKLACGPLSRLITTPSNACTRSLSPSLIFTWTRTVSPGRNAGRSVRCVFASSFSIIRFDMSVSFLAHSPARTEKAIATFSWHARKHALIRILLISAALHPAQSLLVFLAQFYRLKQVRTVIQSFPQSLLAAPTANLLMVAVDQHLRHLHPAKLCRSCVVRIIQQSPRPAS